MNTFVGMALQKPAQVDDSARAESIRQLAMTYQRVCVVGLGYVGLPTALLFARNGFTVQGVDISPKTLSMLEDSTVADHYPELGNWWDEVQSENAEMPRFRASATPEPADVFLITVPTPVHPKCKSCDLSMVRAATESILPVLQAGNLVILESTVPPKTTRTLLKPLIEEATGLEVGRDIFLCFSPERVLPGNTTTELVNNDRVVGGLTPDSALLAESLLARVLKGKIYPTDDVTAEFCKLAENTYRDVNIALANELAILADDYEIDITEARTLINMHPRVNLLKPGIGVGGHCIAVDPWFFVEVSPKNTQLIATSRKVNDQMPAYTVARILKAVAGIDRPRIILLGLTYKPDVADMRESPAVRVAELLRAEASDLNATIVTLDPLAEKNDVPFDLVELARGADFMGVLVGHRMILDALNDHRDAMLSVMRTPQLRVF